MELIMTVVAAMRRAEAEAVGYVVVIVMLVYGYMIATMLTISAQLVVVAGGLLVNLQNYNLFKIISVIKSNPFE